MSADLLAEFDSFYSPSSQQQQQQPPPPQSTTTAAPSQPANVTTDPFAFLSPTTTSPPPAQTSFQSQPWPSFQAQTSTSSWGDLTGLSGTVNIQQSVEEDEDDFGDFEEAPATTNQGPPRANAMSFTPTPMAPASSQDFVPKTRIVRASTMDLMTNNLVDIGGSSKLEPWQQRPSWEKASEAAAQQAKPPPKPKNTDPNVLFDADDFDGVAPEEEDEEDDDFGDFETGESEAPKPSGVPTPTPARAPAIIDLMSTDYEEPAPVPSRKQPPSKLLSNLSLNVSPTTPYPQAPKSPSYQERNPFPGMGIVTPVSAEFPKDSKPKSPSPITAWPTADNQNVTKNDDFGDDWGAFEDLPPDAPPAPSVPATKSASKSTSKPASKPTPEPAESTWDWDAVEPTEATTAQTQSQAATIESVPDSAPPPTNIPPPSILLSIFPSLLSQASTSLFKPTASQPASIRTRVLSSPETASFLQAYLLLATVAARILAGRKLRWHRDKFLSQGMSISAAGGKGGMKLASVDKAQSAQEDREAADLVALWRENVGRLRSAVAAVNAGRQKGPEQPLHIPELGGANMAVQTAKLVPTAPKPCVVCGLKRDERVKGVDFEVEDSFGEWWVEHWGHRACRNFWLEHEAQLRSR